MKRAAALCLALLGLAIKPALANDTVYYYHTDAQGTAVVVTDANHAVVERTWYGPYGEVLNRPLRDGPGYTGHEEDAATGLDNMQQRYYDPANGRFPSPDPMEVDTSTAGNFNRYAYANDNPYRYVDPDGRCTGTHICNDDGTAESTGGFTTGTNGAAQGMQLAQVRAMVAAKLHSETYKQYLGNLATKGIDGGDTSVSAANKQMIDSVTSSSEFSKAADKIYFNDAVLGKETGGIQVYRTSSGGISVVPFVGGPAICSAAAAACMSVPNPDPSQGRLLFEWHPHPISGNSSTLPSEADLERAQYFHTPGVIWANTGELFPQQVEYQAHCLDTGCH